MRLSVASSALAAAFVLTPVAVGYAPAFCQDFSITNQVEPANAGHRDLMRQLQALWDAHAYYPRHASNNDEGGTVKVHLAILPDGRIWTVDVVASSGSPSLDTAGSSVFREGFVRPFPEGEPKAEIDISLHYVLAHRHDQPVAAGYTPVSSKSPFTIMNDPVKSPILETMLQRTCTGMVVREG
jgi:TonB family protein